VGDFAGSAQLAASGSATLRKLASADDASMNVLDLATSAMLIVLPAQVRNPEMTIQYAERLVALDHRRTPEYLFFFGAGLSREWAGGTSRGYCERRSDAVAGSSARRPDYQGEKVVGI
jgi:hypothetical protein